MDFINQRLESKSLEKLSRPILGILSNIFMSFLKSEDVTEKNYLLITATTLLEGNHCYATHDVRIHQYSHLYAAVRVFH